MAQPSVWPRFVCVKASSHSAVALIFAPLGIMCFFAFDSLDSSREAFAICCAGESFRPSLFGKYVGEVDSARWAEVASIGSPIPQYFSIFFE